MGQECTFHGSESITQSEPQGSLIDVMEIVRVQ